MIEDVVAALLLLAIAAATLAAGVAGGIYIADVLGVL